MQGKVRKFFTNKGFGFIKTVEFDTDIFFHVSQLHEPNGDIAEGAVVEFEIVPDRKDSRRFRALNVRPIEA